MKKLKQGDYVRLNNEEIPRHIELLRVNGYALDVKIAIANKGAVGIGYFKEEISDNYFIDLIYPKHRMETELTKHDWVCTVIGLKAGMGMVLNGSTTNQRKGIINELSKLGVNISDSLFDEINQRGFSLCPKEIRCGNTQTYNGIAYTDFCQKLGIEPVYAETVSDISEFKLEKYYTIEYAEFPLICVYDGRTLLRIDSEGYISINEQVVGHEPNLPECLKDYKYAAPAIYNTDGEIKRVTLKDNGLITDPNIITLPDGSTVDLKKPIEVSDRNKESWWTPDKAHYVGLDADKTPVIHYLLPTGEDHYECFAHIRNKPEPDFREGQPVFYQYPTKGGWYFGHYFKFLSSHHHVKDQNNAIQGEVIVKPAINPDGSHNFPPFE